MEKNKPKDVFTLAQFILRFEPSKFDRLKPLLDSNISNLDIGQVRFQMILNCVFSNFNKSFLFIQDSKNSANLETPKFVQRTTFRHDSIVYKHYPRSLERN